MSFATPEGASQHPEGIRCQVYGRVQGVGFRWWTREQARRLGITGWVRNRPDGSVEVLASGEAPTLRRFVAILRDGPAAAHVLRVDTEPTPEVPAEGFDIEH